MAHGASKKVLDPQSAELQVIVPVYNEGENARVLYNALTETLANTDVTFQRLSFVYDLDTDSTLPVIRELQLGDPRVVAEKNQYPRGVVHALRWAFERVHSGPVLILMGDNSDTLSIIPDMVKLWQQGATVVSPSRYLPGGKIHGKEPKSKVLLRFLGAQSLGLLGFPASDPTNNFKLYDGDWLKRQSIESLGGFEIALELTVKAYEQQKQIEQVPTEWFDRTAGESNFKLWKWLPHYLRWYWYAVAVIIKRRLGFNSQA